MKKWDKLFEELFPRKTERDRESYQVVRPESLEAKICNKSTVGLSGTKESFSLVLEFDRADRASVVKMLREAADGVEALGK